MNYDCLVISDFLKWLEKVMNGV